MQDPEVDFSDLIKELGGDTSSPGYFVPKIKKNLGINSPFGVKRNNKAGYHTGIDYEGNLGDPATAPARGKVIFAGPKGKYGNLVIIDHGEGLQTYHGHLSAIGAKVGDEIDDGFEFGKVGSTGNSSGPHRHIETRLHGKIVNPNTVFGKWISNKGPQDTGVDFSDLASELATGGPPPALSAGLPTPGVEAGSGVLATSPDTAGAANPPPSSQAAFEMADLVSGFAPPPPPGDLVGEWHRGETARPREYGGSVAVVEDDAPQWMDPNTADRMAREAQAYSKSRGFEVGIAPGSAPEEVEQGLINELALRSETPPEIVVAALQARGITSLLDFDNPNTEQGSIRQQIEAGGYGSDAPIPVVLGNDYLEAIKEYQSPRAVAGRRAQALTQEAATFPEGSPERLLKLTGARNLVKGVEDNERILARQDREVGGYGEEYDNRVRDWGLDPNSITRDEWIAMRRRQARGSVLDGVSFRETLRGMAEDSNGALTPPTSFSEIPEKASQMGGLFANAGLHLAEGVGELGGLALNSLDTTNDSVPLTDAVQQSFNGLDPMSADVPARAASKWLDAATLGLGREAGSGISHINPDDAYDETSQRIDTGTGTVERAQRVARLPIDTLAELHGGLKGIGIVLKPLNLLKAKAVLPSEFSTIRLIEKAAEKEIKRGVGTRLGTLLENPVAGTVADAAAMTVAHNTLTVAEDLASGQSLEGIMKRRGKQFVTDFAVNMVMFAPGNVLAHAIAKSGVEIQTVKSALQEAGYSMDDLLRVRKGRGTPEETARFSEALKIALPVITRRAVPMGAGLAQTPAQIITQAIIDPDNAEAHLSAGNVLLNAAFSVAPAFKFQGRDMRSKRGEIFEDTGQAEAGHRTRYRVDVDPLTGKKTTGIGGRAVEVGAEQYRTENLLVARTLDKVASLKRKNAPIEDVIDAIDGLPEQIQEQILNEYSVKEADGFTADAEQYMRMARAGSEMASDPTYLERRAQRVLDDAGGRRREVDAEIDTELSKAENDFRANISATYEQSQREVETLETQRIPEEQVEALRAKIPELQAEADEAQAGLAKAQADYQHTYDRFARELEQAGVTGADPKNIPGYQKKVELLSQRANALKEAQARVEATAQHPDAIKELTKVLQDAEKTNQDVVAKIDGINVKRKDLTNKQGEAYNKTVADLEARRIADSEAADKEAQAEATKLLAARDKSIADLEAKRVKDAEAAKKSGKKGGKVQAVSEPVSGEKAPGVEAKPGTGDPDVTAETLKNPERMVADVIDSDKGKAKRIYKDHILKVAKDARIPDFTEKDADATATVITNAVSYIGKTLGNRKTNLEDVERLIFKGKTFREAIKGVPEAPLETRADGTTFRPNAQFEPAQQVSTPKQSARITIFSGGDPTSVLHEFAHAVREGNVLPEGDTKVIDAWTDGYVSQVEQRGVLDKPGLDKYRSELFAHAFERYFTQGVIPENATPELVGAMAHLKEVFQRIAFDTRKHLLVTDEMLSPSMRKFFDRFVSDTPELSALSNPKFAQEESNEEKFKVAANGFVERVFPFLKSMNDAGTRTDGRARANWIAAENDLYSLYDQLFPDRRKRDFYRDMFNSIDDPAVFDLIANAEKGRHRVEQQQTEIQAAIRAGKQGAEARAEKRELEQREKELLGAFDKEVDKLVETDEPAAANISDKDIKDILDGVESEYGKGVAPQKKPFAVREGNGASVLVDGIMHRVPLTGVEQAQWDAIERDLNNTLAADHGGPAENAEARKKAYAEYEKSIRDLTGIQSIADLKAEQAEAEAAEAAELKALAELEQQSANAAKEVSKAEEAKKQEANRIIADATKERDALRKKRESEDAAAAKDKEAQIKLREQRDKESAARLEERRKASAQSEKAAKVEAEKAKKAEAKLQAQREKAAAASEKARKAKVATAERETRAKQSVPKKKITQEEADQIKADARFSAEPYADWNDWKVERYLGPSGLVTTMLPPPGHPLRDQWEKTHKDYIQESKAITDAFARGSITEAQHDAKQLSARDAMLEGRNRIGPSALAWMKERWPELDEPIHMPADQRRAEMRGGKTAPETVGRWKDGKAPNPDEIRFQDPDEPNPLAEKPPEFFSPTERAIERVFKNAKQFPADKLEALLLGGGTKDAKVTGEELADLGIKDLIASSKGKKITKEEVLATLNANRLVVEEKTLGPLTDKEGAQYERFRNKQDNPFANDDTYNRYESLRARTAGREQHRAEYGVGNLKTEGGTEYRELLFKMPRGNAETTKYVAEHFGPEAINLLAHGRIQTRNLDGKDYTEVLEVQSDWHQAGKESGYKNEKTQALQDWARARRLVGREAKSLEDINQDIAYWKEDRASGQYDAKHVETRLSELEKAREGAEKRRADVVAAEAKAKGFGFTEADVKQVKPGAPNPGVEDAPLKDSWRKFVIKKMLLQAAKDGHSGILINDGQIQADRYSLDKMLSSIQYRPDPASPGDFYVGVLGKDGTEHLNYEATTSQATIKDYLGKEWLGRMVAGEGVDAGRGWKKFEGDNLKVEAKGMRVFYDEKIPNWLNKYAKEQGWDVKVEAVDVPGVGKMWKFDLPENVRKSIQEKGQPLYQDPNATDPLKTPEFKNFFKESAAVDDSGKPLVVSHYGHVEGIEVFDRLQPEFRKKGREDDFDSIGNWFAVNQDAKDFGPVGYDAYLSIQNPKRYTSFQSALDDFSTAGGVKPVAAKVSINALRVLDLDVAGLNALGISATPDGTGRGYKISGGKGAIERLKRKFDNVSRDESRYSNKDRDEVFKSSRVIAAALNKLPRTPQGIVKDGAAKFRAKLKAEGYDGIIISEETGIDARRPQTYYVTLEPTQIKQTSNRGTYDPSDPNSLHQDPNAQDPLSDIQSELARIRARKAELDNISNSRSAEVEKHMETNYWRAGFRALGDMMRASLLTNPGVHFANDTSLLVNLVANDILAKPVAATIDRGIHLLGGFDASLTYSPQAELAGLWQMTFGGNRDLSKYGGVNSSGDTVRFTQEWRDKNLFDLNGFTRAVRVFQGDPLSEEYEVNRADFFSEEAKEKMNPVARVGFAMAQGYAKKIYGLLGAQDAFAYTFHMGKHLRSEVIMLAKNEAKNGGNYKERLTYYKENPPIEAIERANMHALIATFNNSNIFSHAVKSGKEKLENIKTWGPAARVAADYALPFVQTPTNILVEGSNWLGLGLAKGAANAYQARKANKAVDTGDDPRAFAAMQNHGKFLQQRAAQQGAQGAVGLAMLTGLAMGGSGFITPQFDPDNPEQRDEASAMREAGKGFSGGTMDLNIFGHPITIQLNQVGPTAAIAYAAAGIGGHLRKNPKDFSRAFTGALQQVFYMAGSHPLVQDTPIKSGVEALQGVTKSQSTPEDKVKDTDNYGLQMAGVNLAKRAFPPLTIAGLAADWTDEFDRQADTLEDKFRRLIPGMRSELKPRMQRLDPDTPVEKTRIPVAPFAASVDKSEKYLELKTVEETQILPRKLEPKKDEKPEAFEIRKKKFYAEFREVLKAVQSDPAYLALPNHETNDIDYSLEYYQKPDFKPATRRDYLNLKLIEAGLWGSKGKAKRGIVQ